MADYFYLGTDADTIPAAVPLDAVDISPGSGAPAVKFTVQDTVYIIGVEDEKALIVDIFKASGLMFNRPTIKRFNAAGVPAREWNWDFV